MAFAQELIRSVPLTTPQMMTTDESGNVYIAFAGNSFVRFTADGDSSAFYRSVSNGEIGWIDAGNPLKVLLYYPAFSKIVLLDKMLSPKLELDLKKLNILNPPAVGISSDGMIWVYDMLNARLKKIDEQLQVVVSSNDLRMETDAFPAPQSLLERNYKVYMVDSIQGIYTFDRFGTYLNVLPFYHSATVQVIGAQLIYRVQDSLFAYDMKSNKERVILLHQAGDIRSVRTGRNRLYVLHNDRLDIYRLAE